MPRSIAKQQGWWKARSEGWSGRRTACKNQIVADGSLAAKVVQLRFDVAANSFFSVLVFNDLLRGPEQGSMALVPQAGVNAPGYSNLPIALARSLKQLVIEKLPSDAAFDLAVRDGTTGFTFFNIEGDQYY